MKTIELFTPGIRSTWTSPIQYCPLLTLHFTDGTLMNYIGGDQHLRTDPRHIDQAMRLVIDKILADYDLTNPIHYHRATTQLLGIFDMHPDIDDPDYALANLVYQQPKTTPHIKQATKPQSDTTV